CALSAPDLWDVGHPAQLKQIKERARVVPHVGDRRVGGCRGACSSGNPSGGLPTVRPRLRRSSESVWAASRASHAMRAVDEQSLELLEAYEMHAHVKNALNRVWVYRIWHDYLEHRILSERELQSRLFAHLSPELEDVGLRIFVEPT